jgi:hypothetical protein
MPDAVGIREQRALFDELVDKGSALVTDYLVVSVVFLNYDHDPIRGRGLSGLIGETAGYQQTDEA